MKGEHTARTLSTAIEARARDLGFDRFGLALALSPKRADLFRRWLAEGKAGTMTYLHRSAERRADPRRVLANAQTIISVGQSYFTGRLPDNFRSDPSRGLIASYAWGRDYHDVLLSKLQELARYIEELAPGHTSKCYVDTGPILEREHGECAGLGFVGKNTLLISPQMGSMFFLGEILTTLTLPHALPVRMPSCGSCMRCLDVCSTHALPTPYVLDSRLCISYLTIEFRGIVPRELRAKMGNHIFGCDDCQDCCPWNRRFSKQIGEAAYRAALERQAPHLTELAMLTASQFHERFAGSAVLRARYQGFLRNVAIALGNWGHEDALESLEHLLHHEDKRVCLHAAWGIGRIDGRIARRLLQRVAEAEGTEEVRQEAQFALDTKEKP